MLKLTLSCLKNVVKILMLSSELTNPVFIAIAFGTSHTYSHWRWAPRNTRNYKKTDGSDVLEGGLADFLATPLLIASFDK